MAGTYGQKADCKILVNQYGHEMDKCLDLEKVYTTKRADLKRCVLDVDPGKLISFVTNEYIFHIQHTYYNNKSFSDQNLHRRLLYTKEFQERKYEIVTQLCMSRFFWISLLQTRHCLPVICFYLLRDMNKYDTE